MSAKPIMIQGTMSNAGKSILTAGLCRVFVQDGYKVAPFKSQNMALNSFITESGEEMGRAQVVQAEASKIKPSVAMNPVLLKPTTDVGAQVIVNGKSIGNYSAVEYGKIKKSLLPKIKEAYDSLAKDNDIIVIEGAGSPAEINLKADDIVNMGMANLVDSPVILVGDIDRGGVFAQLYGTIELMEENEKKRIKGVVVNKFRGDVNILKSGLDMIEDLTKKDVLGVVPYVNLDIDDEDSLSKRLTDNKVVKDIDVAIIKLPRMSNYTDFAVFESFENVSCRYVESVYDIKNADLIILPGTKSTISDYKWLVETGIYSAVKKHIGKNKAVFGICGGYQMLGKRIVDEVGVESGETIDALSVFDFDTVFSLEKVTKQVSGKIQNLTGIFEGLNGKNFEGYEMHNGESGALDFVINKGNVYGSYVHGIFDMDNIAKTMLEEIAKDKGQEIDLQHFDQASHKEKEYDKLADVIRNSLDMKKIYSIVFGENYSK